MKRLFFLLIIAGICIVTRAQNVAINNDGTPPDPKAQLDVKSANKGVLLPRVTDVGVISGDVPLGLLVFVTDGDRGFYYNASATPASPDWKKVGAGASDYWQFATPNYLFNNSAYNVGVGTATPANKFTVRQTGIGITQETGDGAVRMGFYTDATAGYLQTHTNTPLAFATNNGSPQMILTTGGNVGIGNNTPTQAGFVADKKVGAVHALFGSTTTGVAIESAFPGIGFNSFFNAGRKTIGTGYGGWIGQNPASGDLYVQTTVASSGAGSVISPLTRLLINKNGDIGIEGNTAPHAPLSFANTAGGKISLYGGTETANYGIGIQGYLLQLYTDANNADIAFGYGGSAPAAFGENMRIKGNGNVGIGLNNPSERLEIYKGRIRFKGNTAANFAHGLTWTNNAGTADKTFVGQYDDNTLGFYGFPGAGWGLLWDVNDGSLRLGTAQKANGYLLNIGGKAIAEEVRVQLRAAWPDYVFKPGHHLLPLPQLESYIYQNHHLPNIPTAETLEKEGTDLGEMQRKMMEKIEELTLYVIELKKELNQQQQTIEDLKKINSAKP